MSHGHLFGVKPGCRHCHQEGSRKKTGTTGYVEEAAELLNILAARDGRASIRAILQFEPQDCANPCANQ